MFPETKSPSIRCVCAMLEHHFARGAGGSAPINFHSIISYFFRIIRIWNIKLKKLILSHLPVFTIIIIIVVHVAFFSLLFRSCTFPYSTNCSFFNIFATRVQCAAVDRCHSAAESRVFFKRARSILDGQGTRDIASRK